MLFSYVFIDQFSFGDAGASAEAGAAALLGPLHAVAIGLGLVGFALTCIFLLALITAIVTTVLSVMAKLLLGKATSQSHCSLSSTLRIFCSAFALPFTMKENHKQ